jgi:hypothetical protein
MKQITPTRELPSNYDLIDQLDLRDNPGLAMIINLVGVGLLFGVAWLLVRSLSFLRPAYLSSENILVITGMREFWRGILLLVLSLGLMILLSEGLRWLLFWVITGQRPRLGFSGFYTYTSAPEWFISRSTYLIIRLAPLVVITVFGLAAVPIVPLNLVPGVLLLISLNIAAAVNDLIFVWWILSKPADVLIQDFSDRALVFHHSNSEAGAASS